MRRRPRPTLLLALLAGCATTPKLVPEQPVGEQQEAQASAGGVTLTAIPNAWRNTPSSLADQLTPLYVRLVNQSEQAFDITYATLTLVDESGRIYAALPPMEVVRMVVGEQEEAAPPPGPVQVAELESDQVQLAQFGIGFGAGPYDPFYGPGYSPYAYPPPNAGAANAILGSALREGRLLPRTQAMGFVFFQRAYSANVLTLRLEAPSETPGAPPLLLETRFAVAR